MSKRVLSAALAIVLALVVAVLCLLLSRQGDSYHYFGDKLSHPEAAYDFTLIDQNGRPFALHSLRGKLVLMAFGFTHCPNICPTTLGDLAALYRSLPAVEQARVQVLFISVDPERDTPKVLKDYVPFFDQHFIGLTGSPQKIAEAAKAYGAYYERSYQRSKVAANYYTVNHSTNLYVIGPAGKWVGLYRYDQLGKKQRLAEDVKHFLASSRG